MFADIIRLGPKAAGSRSPCRFPQRHRRWLSKAFRPCANQGTRSGYLRSCICRQIGDTPVSLRTQARQNPFLVHKRLWGQPSIPCRWSAGRAAGRLLILCFCGADRGVQICEVLLMNCAISIAEGAAKGPAFGQGDGNEVIFGNLTFCC